MFEIKSFYTHTVHFLFYFTCTRKSLPFAISHIFPENDLDIPI